MKIKNLILGIALLLSAASAFAQGGTTGPLTWEIENNTLTISGEGAMPDYVLDPWWITPWDEYRKAIHSVVIEIGVTRIGNLAFFDCVNLSSTIIPNSVTSIGGMMAFGGCESLPSIVIPSSVTSLYGSAFAGCKSLTSIDVESDNNNYASEDGILFDKNKSVLMYCPEGKTGDYVIPNSVTSIEAGAFAGCESLTSIIIPNSVTNIEAYVFAGCTSLTSIIIPNSITSIGDRAFDGCKSLPSIVIPSSVTSLSRTAFVDCKSLISIDVESDNNNYASEDGVLFDKNKSVLIRSPEGKTGDYVIPNSVTSIESSAFSGCGNLISVIIPNGVTSIGWSTFYFCTNLTSITIPNSITSIGAYAFRGCTSLLSIIIPGSVTKIESAAFMECKLTLITNLNPVPINIASYVFNDMNKSTCTLEVPINSVDAYRNAAVWKEFKIVGVEVGIEPIEAPAFKIYPNPTIGKVYIEMEGEIKVYDAQGTFLQETFGNQVDLSAYPQGVYFLQVNGGRWIKMVKR